MNLVTRMLVGACATAAVLAPTAAIADTPAPESAAYAKAPAKRFKAVQTLEKAKLEVCKQESKNKKSWKVYGRINVTKVKVKGAKFSGSLYVYKEGVEQPTDEWRSPLTKKGKISKAGAVVVPKKGGYTLSGGIGTEAFGDGGPIKMSKVKKC